MHFLANMVSVLQMALALLLVILMAIQTDKAEQGGVMGLGATGGRSAGTIDMAVGAERILKPLTRWSAIGFLFASVLAAMPREKMSFTFLVAALVIYVAIMLYGTTLWQVATGTRR